MHAYVQEERNVRTEHFLSAFSKSWSFFLLLETGCFFTYASMERVPGPCKAALEASHEYNCGCGHCLCRHGKGMIRADDFGHQRVQQWQEKQKKRESRA